ncbi:hypothetical protein [Aquimarina celericrescens]|uniref:Uncharacterized protein n=1 Tax=Aquimarina celericrescens TaxID=1964542 RepID=A0ABW5ASZ5_9FLAO|nr:hypothetical protein [Aquimarina celericrescens]
MFLTRVDQKGEARSSDGKEICPDEALFENYSSATGKKSDKMWLNFRHFLGNRKSQDEFYIKLSIKPTKHNA